MQEFKHKLASLNVHELLQTYKNRDAIVWTTLSHSCIAPSTIFYPIFYSIFSFSFDVINVGYSLPSLMSHCSCKNSILTPNWLHQRESSYEIRYANWQSGVAQPLRHLIDNYHQFMWCCNLQYEPQLWVIRLKGHCIWHFTLCFTLISSSLGE